jgi:septation ring formation regulator EzrA
MVATAETMHSAETTPRFKKAWEDATSRAKDRFKVVEKAWSDTVHDVNGRVQTAEKDVREFLKKVEDGSKERIESIKSSFHVEDLFKRFRKDVTGQGMKLGEEAVERLGLATKAEFEKLSQELQKLADKVEGLRKKLSEFPSKTVFETLKKQVEKLTKAQSN